MKTSKFALIVTLIAVTTFLTEAQSWLTNGLVAYYPFNGNANDSSGNGNDGVVTSAVLTTDRFGSSNSAFAFNGVSSLITVPDSTSLRIPGDITIVCWLKFAQTNKEVRLLGKGDDFFRNYGFWYSPTQPYWLFQQFPPAGGGGCQENTLSSVPVVKLAEWHQLVGIRSGTVSRLYYDGALLQERSPVCSATAYTGGEPLLIGAPQPINDARYALLNGSLDDIRIYNRGLSSNEVADLYAIESGPRVAFVKAFTVDYANLTVGSNYQLQATSDMTTWTNWGAPFTATSANYTNTSYQRIDDWGRLLFRLQSVP